ncbi:antibiotic biosynthesis monooxygenase [Vibrio sp. Isolate22]|uniref:antibiotic biosynthesis monooxygenase family protein n=1 Tax=Vibrio sp. Isolate22 TaxID=2908532 RepID=UPI001EFC5433|nr:antibiotic biosynthesis monooxygenase family protein [Vibrio sp. Isolate22]MCG9695238.1 antibiotic biosynthesis monooxygenase [Vibrio sp. Isolate22]
MNRAMTIGLVIFCTNVFALFANANPHKENVTLINSFTVPEEKLPETISMWEQARDFLQKEPGYISTALHQSLSPDAQYLLVNVAQWESVETYKKATSKMRAEANLPRIEGVKPNPFLYKVIRRD